MKFGILTKPSSWYFNDLQRAADLLSIKLEAIDFTNLNTQVGTSEAVHSGPLQLNPFDALLVRTMPLGSLEQMIYRMDVLASLERLGTLVLNPPRSLEIAIDKYLTTSKLSATNFLVPKTMVCENWKSALQAFAELGSDGIVKPIFGGEGRGLLRVQTEELAETTFKTLDRLNSVIYLQQFITNPGYDIRVLAIGSKMWAVKRSNDQDWRSNVSRGAAVEPYPLSDELAEQSQKVMNTLGVHMAGIDFLPDEQGNLYLLEVNAVPGWKGTAKACNHDMAKEMLLYTQSLVNSGTDN